jgi:hypothetical protein
LALLTPEELEALALPADEGSGRHHRQCAAPIEPTAEQDEGQLCRMRGSAGSDIAFQVEPELLRRNRFSAASELSDRKLRTTTRSKSTTTFSQSRQDLIIDRCRIVSVSALQIGRNLALSGHAGNFFGGQLSPRYRIARAFAARRLACWRAGLKLYLPREIEELLDGPLDRIAGAGGQTLVRQSRERDVPSVIQLTDEIFSAPERRRKKTSLNFDSPVISRSGRSKMPGLFRSTSKYEIPLLRGAEVSVRTSSTCQSARCARLVHTFRPVTTK